MCDEYPPFLGWHLIKAIFQNKLTIYKEKLPSFVQKIIKSRCYVRLAPSLSPWVLIG
jgi:hypothetical protein